MAASPSSFDHAALFTILQRSTLQHRMNDSFSCLVGAHTHNRMEENKKSCFAPLAQWFSTLNPILTLSQPGGALTLILIKVAKCSNQYFCW